MSNKSLNRIQSKITLNSSNKKGQKGNKMSLQDFLESSSTELFRHGKKNVYSPPSNSRLVWFALRDVDKANIGYVIGKNGQHFNEITELCNVDYIWFRNDISVIEIWGKDMNNIHEAYGMLVQHIVNFR